MGARLHQCTGPCQGCLGEHAHRPDPLGHQCHPDAGGGQDRLCLPSRGRPDMKYPLLLATMMLAACGGDPAPTQAGSDPQLPDRERGLLPAMGIANPTPWGNQRQVVPQGYTLSAIATDRSEEHTSELQYLMRTSSAVLCLKK